MCDPIITMQLFFYLHIIPDSLKQRVLLNNKHSSTLKNAPKKNRIHTVITMSPYPSSSVAEEVAGNNNALQLVTDSGFKNLTVKDIVKELSTLAAAYTLEDDYPEDGNGSEYRPVSARVETFVMSAVLGLIFIVGVLGNGTLIAIFLRHRGMRNIPNT